MALRQVTSPHAHAPLNTTRVMQIVLLATIPGLIALTWHFGWGSLINIALACATAALSEAGVMKLRNRPIGFYLGDCSAMVTAVLLGLALPPLAPWWVVIIGTGFAVLIAKHLYGGLGYNPFNPAMIGYVVLLISFPVQMTTWLAPAALVPEGVSHPGLLESLGIVFGVANPVDGLTGATPLDTFKHSTGLLVSQVYEREPLFAGAEWAGVGWEWVNAGFLVGGIFLLINRIFTWHAPVAMLASLTLLSLLFWDSGSSESAGSPMMHLMSGGTMLGAFFIVTDPVTSAVSNRGRLVYGALIGLLVFVIRAWGNYPDAVAFAVLLGNFAAPLIDNYTLPRTYGKQRARLATEKSER